MSKVCTLDLMVGALSRNGYTVKRLAAIYKKDCSEVERLLRVLKRRESVDGGGLFVTEYVWRVSTYGRSIAVPVYRWGVGQDASLSQSKRKQQQMIHNPALVVVAQRVRRGKLVSSPWDGLLRPVLQPS
jgi:hypothetical protein